MPSEADKQKSQGYDRSILRAAKRRKRQGLRMRILFFLDEPQSSRAATFVFCIIVIFILTSVFTVYMSSLELQDEKTKEVLFVLETACSVVFSIEVVLRLISMDSVLSCAVDPFMWIDVLTVLPFFVDCAVWLAEHLGGASTSADIEFLIVLRLLRLLKLARHFESSRVLLVTMRQSADALLVPLFFLVMGVVLFAGILYYTEKDGPAEADFQNMFAASWFVIVTLTTVGYGDVTPATIAGKIVTAIVIVCGVLYMAMPITIVGSSFQKAWEEKEAIKVVLKMQELLLMRDLHAKDVLRVFVEFDIDGDGSLDIDEFKKALAVLGVHLPPDRARKLFKYFDQDANDNVDCFEFCYIIFPQMNEEDFDRSVLEGPTWVRPNGDDEDGESGHNPEVEFLGYTSRRERLKRIQTLHNEACLQKERKDGTLDGPSRLSRISRDPRYSIGESAGGELELQSVGSSARDEEAWQHRSSSAPMKRPCDGPSAAGPSDPMADFPAPFPAASAHHALSPMRPASRSPHHVGASLSPGGRSGRAKGKSPAVVADRRFHRSTAKVRPARAADEARGERAEAGSAARRPPASVASAHATDTAVLEETLRRGLETLHSRMNERLDLAQSKLEQEVSALRCEVRAQSEVLSAISTKLGMSTAGAAGHLNEVHKN